MKDLQRLRELQAEASNRLRELADIAIEQETREDKAFKLGLQVGYYLKGERQCSS